MSTGTLTHSEDMGVPSSSAMMAMTPLNRTPIER